MERIVSIQISRGVVAMMNFQINPMADGSSELVSETRVCADTPAASRSFGAYWHTIYPGSSFIRYMWLRAIRLRAEA